MGTSKTVKVTIACDKTKMITLVTTFIGRDGYTCNQSRPPTQIISVSDKLNTAGTPFMIGHVPLGPLFVCIRSGCIPAVDDDLAVCVVASDFLAVLSLFTFQ